jgi:hypothetical protein
VWGLWHWTLHSCSYISTVARAGSSSFVLHKHKTERGVLGAHTTRACVLRRSCPDVSFFYHGLHVDNFFSHGHANARQKQTVATWLHRRPMHGNSKDSSRWATSSVYVFQASSPHFFFFFTSSGDLIRTVAILSACRKAWPMGVTVASLAHANVWMETRPRRPETQRSS